MVLVRLLLLLLLHEGEIRACCSIQNLVSELFETLYLLSSGASTALPAQITWNSVTTATAAMAAVVACIRLRLCQLTSSCDMSISRHFQGPVLPLLPDAVRAPLVGAGFANITTAAPFWL